MRWVKVCFAQRWAKCWLVCLVAGQLLGCTVLSDPDEVQCDNNDQCSEAAIGLRGLTCGAAGLCVLAGSEGADWSCVGQPVESRTFSDFNFTMLDGSNNRPLPGMDVTVCEVTDQDCSNPIDNGASSEEGVVQLTVPSGPDPLHYLEATVPGENYIPLLQYELDDWTTVEQQGAAPNEDEYVLFSQARWNLLLGLFPATGDPTRGHLILQTSDCNGLAAAGVRLDASPTGVGTVVAYGRNGLPSTSVSETSAEDGWAAYVNLPPGEVSISGTILELDQVLPQPTVIVRAGTITLVELAPRPFAQP